MNVSTTPVDIIDPSPALSPEQVARAEALRVAREVLAARSVMGQAGPDAGSLIIVADFVMRGDLPPGLWNVNA